MGAGVLHIIQNDPEVPPGTISENLPNNHKVWHPYHGGGFPEVGDVSALIVLGGAMGANDEEKHPFLADLKLLISRVVASGVPYIGVCLGGQLLAAACGAKVVSNRWEERGTMPVQLTEQGADDRLFQGVAERFTTFQWHHDSFDLPVGAVLLAASPACPHQAFRIGTCAWGVQFHPEVTESIIRDWCAWDDESRGSTGEMIAAFNRETAAYSATSRLIIHNFLKISGLH